MIDTKKVEFPKINPERNYWLVRSMGGDYYDAFTKRGFIAIGYNKISLDEIKLAAYYKGKANEELRKIIENKDFNLSKDEENPYNSMYAASQMLKFYSDIKRGDIVIIPGKDSSQISIAEVVSNAYEDHDGMEFCPFIKRRKIDVIKQTSRNLLNPELQLMFNSRHIISNVNKYSEFIDNTIYDFYQKDDTTFLVLRVKQEEEIDAVDFNLIPEIIKKIDELAAEHNIPINSKGVKMKICVQSPGDILVFARDNPEIIMMIGMVITYLKGFEINVGKAVSIKVPSLFESLSHLIKVISESSDRSEDRKFKEALRDKVKNMEIETPEELAEIMKEFNKGRKKY